MSNPVRPNILLLLPDQHRRDWTSLDGSLELATPALERLASRGVRFTRAYTPSPLCAPARACLASGLGYRACRVPTNREDYPLDQPTYYQRLRDAGYRVGGVGKFDLHKATLDWNLDGKRLLPEWGFTDGIDNEGKIDGSTSYRGDRDPKGPYLSFLAGKGFADAYVDEHAERTEHRNAYITALSDEAYCDNWVAGNGLRILSSFPADTPWHLAVNFTGPHEPMDVTAAMAESVEGRTFAPPHESENDGVAPPRHGVYSAEDHQRNRSYYAAMIENIDRQIGRMLDLVESRGELDRTLVVYGSDHGEMLGDHRRWGKSSWYEASCGIPFIVAPPDSWGSGAERLRGTTSDALVSLHDLASTFVEAAGAEPLPLAGNDVSRSLVPYLTGAVKEHRRYCRSGLDFPPGNPNRRWRAVIDKRYKLVESEGALKLFDLSADPDETCDLSAERPDVVARMAPLLD